MDVKKIRDVIASVRANRTHLRTLEEEFFNNKIRIEDYIKRSEGELKALYYSLSNEEKDLLSLTSKRDYEFLLDFGKKLPKATKPISTPKKVEKVESVKPSDTKKEETSEKEKDE